MERITLGATDIETSAWCLGTMTWGSQTPPAEGRAQIDRALEAGIDFLDTAEMYPVNPVKAETCGATETVIGDWIRAGGDRGRLVIATKAAGSNPGFLREGAPLDAASLRGALEGSLQRLGTDHVDLYQIHWPDRAHYHFRNNWGFDPSGQDRAAIRQQIADLAGVLAGFVAEGKIRAVGLSNETAWGTMAWNAALEAAGAPRVATMQNEYSLLCRLYDTDMAELSVMEDVTLLAFSPLAVGLLSGKYQGGAVPEGSRMAINDDLSGRKTPQAFEAVAAYLDIADRHGLDPVQMALAWTRTRPFQTVPIFGATDMQQLERILGGIDLALPQEVLDEIEAAHKAHPAPY